MPLSSDDQCRQHLKIYYPTNRSSRISVGITKVQTQQQQYNGYTTAKLELLAKSYLLNVHAHYRILNEQRSGDRMTVMATIDVSHEAIAEYHVFCNVALVIVIVTLADQRQTFQIKKILPIHM